ncbi:Protein of unknown function [Amycolatopsis marina]|uniref:DUF998 domain-containing protein n=2 Tax=Amycolatopsis marina TaxID=490629 RepID=A0A1I1BMC1_9PSEU|nr:Protein of unknown function [Amycolatopsis marina]
MGGDRTQARRARWLGLFSLMACLLALMSLVGLVRSLVAMTYLNVRFVHEVNPVSRAVSYYVFTEHGAEVFAATLVVLAVATLTILIGLVQLRVRIGPAATTLFGVWCLGLVLCAVFPTDNAPRIESVHGLIHQFAGASLFASLPLAGLALARSLRSQPDWAGTGRTVRRLALGAAALAVAYLVARLPDLLPWFTFPAFADFRAYSGLIQRLLFVLELAMLLVLATRLLTVSWTRLRNRPDRVAVPTDLLRAQDEVIRS